MTSETMTRDRLLPSGFEALQPYIGWAMPDEASRYAMRLSNPYEDTKAFHAAMCPLMASAIAYIDGLGDAPLPPDGERLLQLLFSVMEAAVAVEVYNSADIPNAVPADRITIHTT